MKEFLFRNDEHAVNDNQLRNDEHAVNDNQLIEISYHGGFIPLCRKDICATLNKKFGISQTEDVINICKFEIHSQ